MLQHLNKESKTWDDKWYEVTFPGEENSYMDDHNSMCQSEQVDMVWGKIYHLGLRKYHKLKDGKISKQNYDKNICFDLTQT